MPNIVIKQGRDSIQGTAAIQIEEALRVKFQREWLSCLNPSQAQAVHCLDGPLLVLAGAGTGKTRVLTVRLAQLVMEGRVFPSQILAATFTNKAAREIATRVESLLGAEAKRMALGTFHSLSVRFLRRYGQAIGLRRDFTIIDVEDQVRLLKEILQDLGMPSERALLRTLAWMIQRWKDRAFLPDTVPEEETRALDKGQARAVYRIYQQRLLAAASCDFGDLILHTVELFRHNTDILRACRAQYRYILVDEYQDTNVAQYLWLRLLAQEHKNLCCVGDDDQSIYGWRGAEVGNILRFEKDFAGARIIRLERNYRSRPHILAAAAGLIARNRRRMGKTLWTEEGHEEDERVRVFGFQESSSEAYFIAEEIETLRRRRDLSYGEIAILVRAGFQTRAFEETFLRYAIPYRVIGAARFYEREEIRDVVAYLRASLHETDDLAFTRIVNKPSRGIGVSTLSKLRTVSHLRGLSLQGAVAPALGEGAIKGRAAATLQDICEKLRAWRDAVSCQTPRALTERILQDSDYMRYWNNKTDRHTRLENVKELLAAMEEVSSLSEFLEQTGLLLAEDESDKEGRVALMTIHAAKGLEFDAVFLPGWEDGLFPIQRSLEDNTLEEERRLAYVALTRARRHVVICFARQRRRFGRTHYASPSRFLKELPREVLESHGEPLYDCDLEQNLASPIPSRDSGRETRQVPQTLAIGDLCRHAELGCGRIVARGHKTLTVAFPDKGVYRIDPDYVRAV